MFKQENIGKYVRNRVIAAAVLVVGLSGFNYNDSGVSTRLQQPVLGSKWIKEEGYYFKIPLLSRVTSYNQRGTIASSDDESIIESASLVSVPRNYQFADSYEMSAEWSMRYAIPTSDEELEKMHDALKSESNLLGNAVMPFAQTLVNDSVNQMLGGDFAQGGHNALRTLIDDQSQNGMYQTKVEKVKTGRRDGKGSNSVTGGTHSSDLEVTKVVYLTNENGKRKRTPLSVSQYGIQIVPNSIALIETVPQGRLVTYIQNKQNNIALQIAQDEQQKLLVKEGKTAKLKGEKDLISRTNALNLEKQAAIIRKEREVEEAKLQAEKEVVEKNKTAELAIIDKKRELQIAQDNEGIQKANAAAAKYEAQAIKEKGLAEAEVDRAKLAAKQSAKDIYMAEIELKQAQIMYPALKGTNIQMPLYYSNGSNGSAAPTSLDVFTTLGALGKLREESK